MDCPRCAVPLNPLSAGDIEVDECPQCKGVWFDQDELRQAKDLADPGLNWYDFEIWKYADRFKLVPNPLQCPRCNTEMFAMNYDATEVEIDVCNQCRGVWLDGGEFEKIIDALNRELTTAKISDYVRASLREGKQVITGPEGAKAEWKDFTTLLRLMQYRIFIEKPRLLQELIDGQKGTPIW